MDEHQNMLWLGIIAVLAIVGLVLMFSRAQATGQVAGQITCCTTQVWTYAPQGYSQQPAVTQEVFCDSAEDPDSCCLREVQAITPEPIRVLGAHQGMCGGGTPIPLIPYT